MIAGLSAIAGLTESFVLVGLARAAVNITSSDASTSFSIGPLGDVSLSTSSLLGLTAALAAARFVVQSAVSALSTRGVANFGSDLRRTLMSSYLSSHWETKSSDRAGHVQDLTTSYVSSAQNMMLAISAGIASLLSLAVLAITAMLINLPLALALIVLVVALGLVLRPLSKRAKVFSKQFAAAGSDYAATAAEITDLSYEIHTFAATGQFLERAQEANDRTSAAYYRSRLLSLLIPVVYQALALLLVIGSLFWLSSASGPTVGGLSAMLLLFVRAAAYGQQTQSYIQTINATAPFAAKLQAEIGRYRPTDPPKSDSTPVRFERLTLSNVFFSYTPDRQQAALRDVTLHIPRGTVLGVLGPSGAGKTTLVELLLGLRGPTSGEVEVDGTALSSIPHSRWARTTAAVPQAPHIFTGTIYDNIAMLDTRMRRADVEFAADLAGLTSTIRALPQGFETPIGRGSRALSGGQQQRLAIARALVHRPRLLILDEPTSALDSESEAAIHATLERLRGHVTMVIIAHRLSTLDVCDDLVVLRDGSIQHYGPAAAVRAASSLFRTNDSYQAGQSPGTDERVAAE